MSNILKLRTGKNNRFSVDSTARSLFSIRQTLASAKNDAIHSAETRFHTSPRTGALEVMIVSDVCRLLQQIDID